MAREPHFVVKYSSYLGTAIKLVLYILKQLSVVSQDDISLYPLRHYNSLRLYKPPHAMRGRLVVSSSDANDQDKL